MPIRRRHTFLAMVFVFLVSGLPRSTTAQETDTITKEMNYFIHFVTIKGRWVPKALLEKVSTVVGKGRIYDPSKLGPGEALIRDELTGAEQLVLENTKGSSSVLFINASIKAVPAQMTPKQVDVEFTPYYLRVDLFNVGNNVLPVPRTAKATFLVNVPALYWIPTPVLGFRYDRTYGSSFFVGSRTDLLNLSKKTGKITPSSSYHLILDLNGEKSSNQSFGSFESALSFVKANKYVRRPGWFLGVGFKRQSSPLGTASIGSEVYHIKAGLQGISNVPLFSKYVIGGGLTNSSNKTTNLYGKNLYETGYNVGVTGDNLLAGGVARLGMYFDHHFLIKDETTTYKRLRGSLAYGTTIGKGHANVDLETSLGAGLSFGTLPIYSTYFGGNRTENFLYESLDATIVNPIVQGPLIRSLGQHTGVLTSVDGVDLGGKSYWNANVTLAIPILGWSKPLVPDIVITRTPRTITLRSALKGAISTAQSAIREDLVERSGYPDTTSTDEAAEAIVNKDIAPTVKFLADRANTFAIKPLLLFDAAGLHGSTVTSQNTPSNSKTWFSAGVGLQVSVVIAKFQLGYSQTLAPSSDSRKGNLIVGLSLQNFY